MLTHDENVYQSCYVSHALTTECQIDFSHHFE